MCENVVVCSCSYVYVCICKTAGMYVLVCRSECDAGGPRSGIINNICTVDMSEFLFFLELCLSLLCTVTHVLVPISVDTHHEAISSHLIALVVF